MSSRREIYGRGRIERQFVGIRHEVLDSAAWKAMTLGARWYYVALLRKLDFKKYNNGRVFLSFRDAVKEINASQKSIWIWQRELEHYGFTVLTKPGTNGQHGRAAEWRLTDYGWGQLDEKPVRPTKDYLQWDGVLFDRKTIEGRQLGSPKIVKREKKVLQPAVKSTAHNVVKNTAGFEETAGKSTAQCGQVNDAKNTAHLDSPYSYGVAEPGGPGIGHNLGPPLTDADNRRPWTTPILTELEWSDDWARLYATADDLTIPQFLRREIGATLRAMCGNVS